MTFNKECVLQEKQKHRKKIHRENLPPEMEGFYSHGGSHLVLVHGAFVLCHIWIDRKRPCHYPDM